MMVDAVRARFRIMLGVFAVLTGLIVIRLISLQFGNDVLYFESQYQLATGYLVTVTPPRGHIYDRTGELLATNDVKYAIGLSPDFITDPEGLAKILSSVLGRSYDEMLELATQKPTGDVKYLLIQRPASAEAGEKLIALQRDPNGPNLGGLIVEPMQTRVYPNGTLGAHVFGFVGLDNKGYYGVEEFYNDILAGHSVVGIKQVVPFDVALNPTPDMGADLYLTIDREIQYLAETTLTEAVQRYGAEGGQIIVMEPKTGRILAMAVNPAFDPNNYLDNPDALKPNPAVSAQYEPGSTFKVLTMAAALQSGAVTPETTYQDVGLIEVGGVRIRNWNGAAWGTQDMTGVLQHSLNVGTAWVSTQMGPKAFYDYMTAFGIGQVTNVDLSGESAGHLKRPGDSDWFESDLGTNAFGQGIATTPVQLLTAISAIANGGAMMQPHLLERVVDGDLIHTTQPQVLGRPISADVAATLNSMLAVSMEREASDALLPGYRLAGKTGTAQIPVPGGYDLERSIASFVGWGPVDDPRFIVLIKFDKPAASIWGSETAAPTFGEMVKRLVVLMNIPPDNVRQELAAQAAGQ
ncbi:MAG TPA: penicillin-binding protein 2 [Anaerolineales bacterium]|nr:penicillin-binding protein 2 [Anaerolineales bacterium]